MSGEKRKAGKEEISTSPDKRRKISHAEDMPVNFEDISCAAYR